MIAKSTQQLLVFLTAGLCACTSPSPTPRIDPDNPGDKIQLTRIPAKIQMVVVPLVSTGLSIAQQIKKNKQEELMAETIADSIIQPTSITDIQNQMAPPLQEFTVDNSQDNMITCEKGTKVFLPANVFDTDSDSIHVCVQEFYSKTDFISRDLSTVSDGRLLESGGTVKVTATTEDEWLEVKEGESYTILFPKTPGQDANMETFYGERDTAGIMNWTPATQEDIVEIAQESLSDGIGKRVYMTDHRIWFLENKWRFMDSEEDRNIFQYFYEEYNEVDTQAANYKYFPFYEDEFEGKETFFCYTVSYDDDGYITEADLQKRFAYVPEDIDQSVSAFLMDMPPIDKTSICMFRLDLNPLAFVFTDNLCFVSKLDFVGEDYRTAFVTRYKDYQDKVIEKMPRADLDYYMLSTAQVGWINCDQFLEGSSQSATLTVASPGIKKSKVFLVFENSNSVLCASECSESSARFRNVPNGAPAKVVAITFINEQPVMAVKKIMIDKAPVRLDEFQPFSIGELTAALE